MTDDDAPRPPRTHVRLVETPRPQEVEDARPANGRDGAADAEDVNVVEVYEPEAAAEPAGPPPLSPRFVVLALLAFQALGALSYLGKYAQLTRDEVVSPAAAILSVPAALALYAGALLLAVRPGRGRGLFLGAAVGLGIAVPFWGISYSWTWPVAAGSMLGLAGAWVARAAARQNPALP